MAAPYYSEVGGNFQFGHSKLGRYPLWVHRSPVMWLIYTAPTIIPVLSCKHPFVRSQIERSDFRTCVITTIQIMLKIIIPIVMKCDAPIIILLLQ